MTSAARILRPLCPHVSQRPASFCHFLTLLGSWDPLASARPVGRVGRQSPVQQSEAVSRASAQHAAIVHGTAPAECGLCACRAAGWGLEDEPEEPPAEQGQWSSGQGSQWAPRRLPGGAWEQSRGSATLSGLRAGRVASWVLTRHLSHDIPLSAPRSFWLSAFSFLGSRAPGLSV